MNVDKLLARALNFEFLSKEEGIYLYQNAATADLTYVANILRKIQVPHGKVTWQIDRNVNTTNVCIANCKFCNFSVGRATKKVTLRILKPTNRKSKKPFGMAETSCCYKVDIIQIWAWSFTPLCSNSSRNYTPPSNYIL